MTTPRTTHPASARSARSRSSIRDIERAERFYGETLGLPHVFTFGDLAFFDADGTRLYLHRKDEADWRSRLGPLLRGRRHPRRPGVARPSGASTSPARRTSSTPHDDGIEEWMTFFDDGEGNTLALMSRVSP